MSNAEKIIDLSLLVLDNRLPDDVRNYITEYRDLLEAIDKAEPVAWIDEMGRPYSMLTYPGKGTKLCAHPPKQESCWLTCKCAVQCGDFYAYTGKPKPIDERAEFEKWKKTMLDGWTDWGVWQARAKLSAPVVPDEISVTKVKIEEAIKITDWVYSLVDFNQASSDEPPEPASQHDYELLQAASALHASLNAMLKGEK